MKRLFYAILLAFAALAVAGALIFGGRQGDLGGPAGLGTAGPGGSGFAGSGVAEEPSPYYGATLEPARTAPDFTLIDQHGNEFRLSDYVGDVVVLFFGYTSCPDVCPGTLAQYRYVKHQRLSDDEKERIQFVFVTVDPQRDTRERLLEYINLFDPEFKALTGDPEALREVWRSYGVYIERVEAPESPVGYWINHTAISYVIDASGNLRLALFYGMPDEQVAHDLKLLAREAAS